MYITIALYMKRIKENTAIDVKSNHSPIATVHYTTSPPDLLLISLVNTSDNRKIFKKY
jgi:hypothetical protein